MVPPGVAMAEIGVSRGCFSALMLECCRPKRLFLVDRWRPFPNFARSKRDHDAAYRYTRERFRDRPEVKILRMSSLRAAAALFARSTRLDFVYIDADHRRECVMEDLVVWSGLLAFGGLIGGHDYYTSPKRPHIGVVQAVTEFCATHPFRLVHVTRETYPSFLLAHSNSCNS
jgi:hypothetical protein